MTTALVMDSYFVQKNGTRTLDENVSDEDASSVVTIIRNSERQVYLQVYRDGSILIESGTVTLTFGAKDKTDGS